MFFLIRMGLLILSILIIGGFLIKHVPSIRDTAIQLANPQARQADLFAQLDSALNELNTSTIDIKNSTTPAELRLASIKQEQALATTQSLVKSIKEASKGNTSILDKGVTALIDSLVGTPTPPPSAPALTTGAASNSPAISSLPSPGLLQQITHEALSAICPAN